MVTWKELINDELKNQDDKLIACTLSEEELNTEFYDGYGSSEGKHFTAWSETRVYFPVVYDGAEWVGSVPRNPCEERTGHVGGE